MKCKLDDDSEKALSRVAIGLLAARILEDKGIFGPTEEQSANARKLLDKADALADGFFKHVIINDLALLDVQISSRIVDEMLLRIMAHLTGPASFSMVTPEMLGDLYENLLRAKSKKGKDRSNVLRAKRKKGKDRELNGIHYIPLSLARNVLRRIPVEELPPARRYALDFAYGSGTFLLAATERLRSVFDANEADSESELLDHLRSHVIGNDRDSVAILVANLTYLLEHVIQTRDVKGVPVPDIRDKDALDLTHEIFRDRSPSIIVGNPPFGRATDGDQLANKFLLKALELLVPGGFLGMVMPGAFLKGMQLGGVTKTRRRLLRECELLEVWEMPVGTVGLSARQETCVIIARKVDREQGRHAPTLFQVTSSSNHEAIRAQRDHLRSTWTFMATGLPGRPLTSWAEDTTARIIASPLDHVWANIRAQLTLGHLCEQTEGIKATRATTSFSGEEQEGFSPYLRFQSWLHPYFLEESDWRRESRDPDEIRYNYVKPETADRSRKDSWSIFKNPKILISCIKNRNSYSQLKAAYDENGVFPEHSFKCFALRDEFSALPGLQGETDHSRFRRAVHLWLVAILNSPVAHAWVATCSSPRSTAVIVFNELPLPRSFDPRIVQMMEVIRRTPRGTSIFQDTVNNINEMTSDSYGLSVNDVKDLSNYLSSLTEPWVVSPRESHLPKGRSYRRISGSVIGVDVNNQLVTLDLPRYSNASAPLTLLLPRELPGWALREGTDFTCAVPTDCRDVTELLSDPWILRDFRPVPYSYLDEDELEELVGFEHSDSAH